jgi:hypothetical protein
MGLILQFAASPKRAKHDHSGPAQVHELIRAPVAFSVIFGVPHTM